MRAGEKGILALEVTVCVLLGLARCIFLNTKFKKVYVEAVSVGQWSGTVETNPGIWGRDPSCCGQRSGFQAGLLLSRRPPVCLLYKSRSAQKGSSHMLGS